MKVDQITYDGLLDAIHEVRTNDAGSNFEWSCDPKTFNDVNRLDDGDGHLIAQTSNNKSERQKLFGYPVNVSDKYNGLFFGRPNSKESSGGV